MATYTLGLDIGTSGCKAMVVDASGACRGAAARSYDLLLSGDGGAELDSDAVIQNCLTVIREAASTAGAGTVCAVGVSSQGEAFTAVGPDGNALCNAMVSSDTRSEAYVQAFVESFGDDRLYRITGHTAHPMFTLFKLLWLKEQRPAIWAKSSKFLCFEDLLALRLGVAPAMGWPLAGRTMLFDVHEHTWSPAILDAVGLRPDQLARPLASGTVSGIIPPEMAARLGLAAGAVLVTGGHDQPCAALGSGVTQPGVAMYATGTVECITPAFSELILEPRLRRANLCTYDHTINGMYATVAFSLTGGNILKWFRDELGAAEVERAEASGKNAYELLLEAAATEPSSLLVLPYFTPSGTPYFDTSTPGAVVGLRLGTSRGDLIRGLLEGVALEMRLNLEILGDCGCAVDELRAVGGGAKSKFWTQLKADVIGKPITVLSTTEAGCLGAAMLARGACTGTAVRDLAAAWVRPVERCEPRPHLRAHYNDRFEQYKRLYKHLSEWARKQ